MDKYFDKKVEEYEEKFIAFIPDEIKPMLEWFFNEGKGKVLKDLGVVLNE